MKIIFYTFLYSLIVTKLPAQTKITIKKNTVLKYVVTTVSGETYPFNVTVTNYSASGIKFNWTMDRQAHKGTVTIYKAALDNALTYKNYFANNSNEKLTKESTVWLSQKNFKELITTKATTMALDFTLQKFVFKQNTTYSTTLNNKKITLNTLAATSETSTNNVLILNDATTPLIIKMQVKDFTIILKEITQ